MDLMMNIKKMIAVTALLIPFASASLAGSDSDCDDMDIRVIPAADIGSDGGESCGHGVAFTFQGIHYAPSDDKCPSWVEHTPSYGVPSGNIELEGYEPKESGQVDVTQREYLCEGLGCGILFLQGCCVQQGDEDIVNHWINWDRSKCKKNSDAATPVAPAEEPESVIVDDASPTATVE